MWVAAGKAGSAAGPGGRGQRVLLLGILVSLVVHAALMAGFVRYSQIESGRMAAGREGAPEAEFLLIPPEEPEKRPRIRLGLDEGSPDASAWLGFEDETDHAARQGEIDQSAIMLAERGPAGEAADLLAEPGPAMLTPSESAEAEAPDDHAELVRSEPAEGPIDKPPNEPAEPSQTTQRLGEALRDAIALVIEAVADPPELPEPANAASDQSPPPAAATSSAHAGAPPLPESIAGADGQHDPSDIRGIPAERESIATAVRAAPTIRPGRVLAAEGLEIQTRAPRWSNTTKALRRPRNPTVEIFFGADGRVRRANFVRDGAFIYDTGSEDVDQPLLNAVYAWTARGKAIDELSEGGDGGEGEDGAESDVVRVMITIILVG